MLEWEPMECQWKGGWSALNLVVKEGFMLKVIFSKDLKELTPGDQLKG